MSSTANQIVSEPGDDAAVRIGEYFNPHPGPLPTDSLFPQKIVAKITEPIAIYDCPKGEASRFIKLRDGPKRIYDRLVGYAAIDNKGYCWPGEELIAAELGKSARQVRRDIETLQKVRLIGCVSRLNRKRGSVLKNKSKANTYGFLVHPSLLPLLRGQQCPVKSYPTLEEMAGQNANVSGVERTDSPLLRGQQCPPNTKEIPTLIKDENSSSSSGPSGLAADEEEDDVPLFESENQNPETRTALIAARHSAEDIESFGGFLQKFLNDRLATLERYLDGAVPALRTESVVKVTQQAPGWTVQQIAFALEQNKFERPCRPQTYAWFPKVVAGIYADRNGIPPVIAVEKIGRQNDQYTPYSDWIKAQPPDVKQEPKCFRCRDTGVIQEPRLDHEVSNRRSTCPECDLGRKLKAEQDAKNLYETQSDRWHLIYNDYRARGCATNLDFSEVGMAFHAGTAEIRDVILVQLEAGVAFDKVELPEASRPSRISDNSTRAEVSRCA